MISLLKKSKIIESVLLYVNKYSFPIYLLHTIFTAGIRIVLNKVGISDYGVHVIVAMSFGIGVPVIVAWISNKTPLLDFFLYPSRSIKRLKKDYIGIGKR